MNENNRNLTMEYEALRSRAFGDISNSYAAIGSPLSNPAVIVKIYNGTDVDLLISHDGSTDHDLIPSSATLVLDVSANKNSSQGLFFRKGLSFFVKETSAGSPSSGSIYLSTLYID